MQKKRKIHLVFRIFFLTGFLWLGTGCADANSFESPILPEKPVSEPDPVSLREVIPLWESKVSQGKEWTAHVNRQLDLIGADLLVGDPQDSNLFCGNYDKLSDSQRRQYWTFILSMMVKYESGFNTNAKLTEKFTDYHGRKVISRGLLQISIESSHSYDCGLRSSQDLHDPLQNLTCGIRILNRWVKYDRRIAGKVSQSWRGGARYWAVLRSVSGSYKSILKASQKLAFCKM